MHANVCARVSELLSFAIRDLGKATHQPPQEDAPRNLDTVLVHLYLYCTAYSHFTVNDDLMGIKNFYR